MYNRPRFRPDPSLEDIIKRATQAPPSSSPPHRAPRTPVPTPPWVPQRSLIVNKYTLVLICSLIVLGLGILGGKARLEYLQQPETTINDLCNALHEYNYQKAYADFSPRFQSMKSEDDFYQWANWYTCTYHTSIDASHHTTIGLHHFAFFDDTSFTCDFTLIQGDWGIWKIDQMTGAAC